MSPVKTEALLVVQALFIFNNLLVNVNFIVNTVVPVPHLDIFLMEEKAIIVNYVQGQINYRANWAVVHRPLSPRGLNL